MSSKGIALSPLPLSRIQKEVLVHTINFVDEARICYRDIISIFQFIDISLYSKEEIINLIVHGGNAFLNHLIFCLIYMREWTEEAKHVFHVHDIALRLNSALSPQMYRYVWLRVQRTSLKLQIEVLERGKGWFVNPLDAKDQGMSVKDNLRNPFLSDCFSPVLMLESSCTCLVYLDDKQRELSRDLKCNCLIQWESIFSKWEQIADIDEVDAISSHFSSNALLDDEGYVSSDNGFMDTLPDSAIIDGIKISRRKEKTDESGFHYKIEHSNVNFSSVESDIVSAYSEYVAS